VIIACLRHAWVHAISTHSFEGLLSYPLEAKYFRSYWSKY